MHMSEQQKPLIKLPNRVVQLEDKVLIRLIQYTQKKVENSIKPHY